MMWPDESNIGFNGNLMGWPSGWDAGFNAAPYRTSPGRSPSRLQNVSCSERKKRNDRRKAGQKSRKAQR